VERRFRISTRPNELPGVLDQVEEFCRAGGFPMETVSDVRLLAEEVLTNIVKYAHDGGGEHVVDLKLSAASRSVRMEFRDEGTPFNPLETAAPDLDARLEPRAIGGLGVHLVRALADDASYSREGKVNVLILIKHAGSTI
jgi:anti-sigma regulatory factor (Ser/Thr protein kinase)